MLEVARSAEVRLHVGLVVSRTVGNEKDRDSICPSLCETAEGVFRARTSLTCEQSVFSLGCHQPRVTVGGHDAASFLAEHDRSYAFLCDCFNEWVRREACQPLKAFHLEDFRDCFVAVHKVKPSLFKFPFARKERRNRCRLVVARRATARVLNASLRVEVIGCVCHRIGIGI